MKIPLFRPQLGKEELRGLAKIFKTGWVALGPKTAELENKFAAYIGTKYAVGVNSGTAALHLAFTVFNFPRNSEVLMPAINFISGPHAAVYCGLKPVLVDVEADTLCMDVNDMERKIGRRTRAILAVHLGGRPVDMDAVMKIARRCKLVVIEDVANAVGGEYKHKKLGSIGHIGCHSFEAKKNMTTGDGGMLTLNNGKLAAKLRRLRWLGINKDTWKRFSENKGNYSWYYEVGELGYKYNMNDIMAVIGLAQLRKLDGFLRAKRKLAANYDRELGGLAQVSLLETRPWDSRGYWLYIIKVAWDKRDRFMQYLSERSINTGVHFMPTHLHPLYRNLKAKTPIADRVWRQVVSLPFYPSMTPKEQSYVINAIKKFQ